MSMLSLSKNLVNDLNKSLVMLDAKFRIDESKSDIFNYCKILYMLMKRLENAGELDFEEKFELCDVVSNNRAVRHIVKYAEKLHSHLLTYTSQELMDGLSAEESERILEDAFLVGRMPDPGTFFAVMKSEEEKKVLQKHFGHQII